jgi:hypothetical protein
MQSVDSMVFSATHGPPFFSVISSERPNEIKREILTRSMEELMADMSAPSGKTPNLDFHLQYIRRASQ